MEAQHALEQDAHSLRWGAGTEAAIMLLRLDPRGVVTHVCAPDERLLRGDSTAIQGAVARDVLIQSAAEALDRAMQSLQGGVTSAFIELGVASDHGELDALWEMTVFCFSDMGATVVLRDMSYMHRAHVREREYIRRLRDLAIAQEHAADEQRRLIATELHDRVIQVLAAARLHLQRHHELHREVDVEEREPHHQSILALIDDAIAESRAITRELAPFMLYELGLQPAISALCTTIEDRHGVRCVLDYRLPASLELDSGIITFAYRSIQELLVNVARHAQTDQATARIAADDGVLRITVCDHGKGFDPMMVLNANVSADAGFGLLSIRSHAERLGGDLNMYSQEGLDGGSCFVLQVPMVAAD